MAHGVLHDNDRLSMPDRTDEPGTYRCLSTFSTMIAVLDGDGRIVHANQAFRQRAPAWRDSMELPRLSDIWPAIAAALPELRARNAAVDATTQVREVPLATGPVEMREHLAVLDPISCDDLQGSRGWLLSLFNVSHLHRSERSWRDSIEIEMVVSRLSSRFVGSVDIQSAVSTSLRDIGELTDASRVFFASWQPCEPGIDEYLMWQRPGVPDLRRLLIGHRPLLRTWYGNILASREPAECTDLHLITPPPIRELMAESGDDLSGALVMFPLIIDGQHCGVVGMRYAVDNLAARTSGWVILDIFSQILERALHLQRSQRALEDTHRELHTKSAQLVQSEKMASIGQIAAGVAHEINNPIGYVLSNLCTLKDYAGQIKAAIDVCRRIGPEDAAGPDTARASTELDPEDLAFIAEDLDDLLAESLEGCERVREIVQNLKGFARADDTTMQPTDLNACVESSLRIAWNELKYRCDIRKELGDLPPVMCYPGKINQVIMNLLMNAAHAIEDRGTVTIRTSEDQGLAVVTVEDTGCGISEDVRRRIFDPFFTTKQPGKGTGLGLYICHDIIQEHDGEIDVSSAVGQGTTISLRLPLVAVDTDGEDIIG